ncbi:MAG: hypothetical protein K2Q19_07305 [Rhodocyclaceae bacterium]|jgi:hypothetical protein|nr:hypothetical protein [Rhodocyclaceae bacterium]
MGTSLTKIDVARRQLKTAINLLFSGGDSVSIFSLAANAWEVIDALCVRNNIGSLSVQTRTNVPQGLDLKYDYINSPYRNFFKHADRDHDRVLQDFDEAQVDAVMILAVEDYLRLTKKSPIEFQVYQLWYLATYVEKVKAEALTNILDSIESTFPRIRELSRPDRLSMGRRVLEEMRNNQELLADPHTEQGD